MQMKFRLHAFGLHLLGSALALTSVLGALYLGWYYWPGWYLTNVKSAVVVMVAVDVVIGPLLTLIIANEKKPRRELARDVAIIVALQLIAFGYGGTQLWNGRPLYYTYSEGVLEIVQAYDIDAAQVDLGRQQKPDLAPHWYSRPKWIWAPLPTDPDEANKIVQGTITGGADVIAMPRYYQPWSQGLTDLRTRLKNVDGVSYFYGPDKKKLAAKLQAMGIDPAQARFMPLTGRGGTLLAVFNPETLTLERLVSPK